jgi:hypothetical protein
MVANHTLKAYAVVLVARHAGDDHIEYDALVIESHTYGKPHEHGDVALGGGSIERPGRMPIDKLGDSRHDLTIRGMAKELSEELGLNEAMMCRLLHDDRYTIQLNVMNISYRGAVHEVTPFIVDATRVLVNMYEPAYDMCEDDMVPPLELVQRCKDTFLLDVNSHIDACRSMGGGTPPQPRSHGSISINEVNRIEFIAVPDLWKYAYNNVVKHGRTMWEVNAYMILMNRRIMPGINELLARAGATYGLPTKAYTIAKSSSGKETTCVNDVSTHPATDSNRHMRCGAQTPRTPHPAHCTRTRSSSRLLQGYNRRACWDTVV